VHNLFTNLKLYLHTADKNIIIFFSRFMHYHLDLRLLQGHDNTFCDIHIFSASTKATKTEGLLFSIQKLTIVKCSGDMQAKSCVVFLCKPKFALLVRAKIKFCVFFRRTMCVIIFFVVQLVQLKYLRRYYVSYRNEIVL